jgi:predicted PurR-regulated permease PerM
MLDAQPTATTHTAPAALAAPAPAAEPAPTSTPPAPAPDRSLLQVPVDVRSLSLVVIATILSLYALQWSRDLLAPIVGGILLSYALSPVVSWLERARLPRAFGATAVLCALLGMLSWGGWALGGQVHSLIDTVPAVTQRVREISQRFGGKESTIEKVRMAADNLTAAAGAAASPSTPASAARAPVPQRQASRTPLPAAPTAADHGIDVRGYLLSGTLGAMSFLGKMSVVLLVALFIMASGSSFRRKMVKIAGNTLSQKKVTVQTLDDITDQIQRYLLVQVGVSLVVGVLTGLAFFMMGLSNAGAWGLAAGLTNLVPYVGAVVLSGGAAIVALVQFGTLDMAIAAAAVSMGIHAVVGNVLTPWWMGRASKMSTVAVFVAVLVFGWLWGVWGLLLGVPVLLVVKSVCDHVEDLKPVGELLGP